MLSLSIISRKFKNFQTFLITVHTEHLLKKHHEKPESNQEDIKMDLRAEILWLRYDPRTTIKAQILADFIADFALGATQHADH